MWQFEFDAPVGTRILGSRFTGITHFSFNKGWFSYADNKWVDTCAGPASSHAVCKSFKAFKRHLRKHPELKDVGEVILVSRFIGYNITAKWIN